MFLRQASAVRSKAGPAARPLRQTKLDALMVISSGCREVVIGIVDGPVDFSHPGFQGVNIQAASETQLGACRRASSVACHHGTAVAGILCAQRSANAPGICPACTVILRPVFGETLPGNRHTPTSTPTELANAIRETIEAGAKIINLSLGLSVSSLGVYRELEEVCHLARRRGVLLVAASGNQGSVGYLPLLSHPWIIPVAACDAQGRLLPESNISPSIGRRGLMAPGMNIVTTASGGGYAPIHGTSAAAPFVSGALALLWSLYPKATADQVRESLLLSAAPRRRTVTPPLLHALAARNILAQRQQ